VTTIKTTNDDPTTLKADALVIGVAQGQVAQGQVAQGQEGPLLAGGSEAVDAALGGRLAAVLASLGATGKAEEVTRVPTAGVTTAPVVVAVGLGRPGPDGTHAAESLRRASGAVARALAGTKRVATTLVAANAGAAAGPDDLRAVAEGWLLGSYRFTDYLSTTRAAAKEPVATVVLLGLDAAAAKAAKPVLARAAVVADAVALVRDLVNTPPADLPPAVFADRAKALAAKHGLEVEVLDDKALRKGGYGGLTGVGQGSLRPPRLVRLHWHGHPTGTGAGPAVALVGKGITFDSGGLSLKPPAAMETMKSDMAGAAATLATLVAAARLDHPTPVTGWLPLAENMPSGTAIRPSDVLTIRGGTTVEVLNTDAEGRLVLADAIVRAAEESPSIIVDIATLTGAQVVALGTRVSGVMGRDGGRERVVAAADAAGEQTWPMPLPAELRASIDSEIADLQNIGDRNGGMLTAGLFLQEFVPAGTPWAHVDIAGPSFNSGAPHGYTPKGGTGVAVRTLLGLLDDVHAAAGGAATPAP